MSLKQMRFSGAKPTARETLWVLRYALRRLRRDAKSWRDDFLAWRRFWRSYRWYQQIAPPDTRAQLAYLYPRLGEDIAETPVEPTYFYQDAWAFEKIVERRPVRHVDVGSHHKFVALLSKVVPVTMVDIRPLSLPLDTLNFEPGSIVELPFEDDSLESLSSICVVEHIGLGRYGDPLDPRGSEQAIAELRRVLAPGGRLYLSVPVGDEDLVAFNAGRVFSLGYLYSLLEPLVMVNKSFIVGDSLQESYGYRGMFGTTGLFELVKEEA